MHIYLHACVCDCVYMCTCICIHGHRYGSRGMCEVSRCECACVWHVCMCVGVHWLCGHCECGTCGMCVCVSMCVHLRICCSSIPDQQCASWDNAPSPVLPAQSLDRMWQILSKVSGLGPVGQHSRPPESMASNLGRARNLSAVQCLWVAGGTRIARASGGSLLPQSYYPNTEPKFMGQLLPALSTCS